MTYIPILTQKDLVLDTNGKIIPNAKIEVLNPISSNPIDVFTYDAQNDRYVAATNPIFLNNESRPQHTYFVTQLAYCRLSKYMGDFMDPLTHSTAARYDFIRDWYGAFTSDDAHNDTLVYGYSGLEQANPELGAVTVVGYWTDKDCEARTYVWDPNCVQDADGGYIVKNPELDTGRWILMFDGEYLPSTYYGVYPGHESTMNALLNYVATVGTAQKPTAPGIYFVPGSYTDSTVALVTNKKLLIDSDTSFLADSFTCTSVKVIGDSSNSIVDFVITDDDQEAHSSWFRTIAGFLTCGAKTLYFDATNQFLQSKIIPYNITVSNARIVGKNRLPISSYQNNARVTYSNCTFVGEKFFNSTDRVGFAYTAIKDTWFSMSSANDFDFNDKIMCRSTSLNKVLLENFESVPVYVKALRAYGATTIDLAGRVVNTTLDLNSFSDIRNVYANAISCYQSNNNSFDVTLTNVHAAVSFSGRYLTVKNSEIDLQSEPTCAAMWADDSRVTGYKWTNHSRQIRANNCYWGIGMEYATDNEHDTAYVEFINCTFQTNVMFTLKRAVMKRCTTDNNSIKFYPIKSEGVYYLNCTLENNVFNNTSPIEFTKFDDDNCYDCMVNWTILGNTFAGNTEGLRCRFWQNRIGQNYNMRFIKTTVQNINYHGNLGQCPAEDMTGVSFEELNDGHSNSKVQIYTGYSYRDVYRYTGAWKRVMPIITSNYGTALSEAYLEYLAYHTVKQMTMIKYKHLDNVSPWDSLIDDIYCESHGCIYHSDLDNPTGNGDFFKMGSAVFDRPLWIIQQGDNDRKQFIWGKFI